MAHQLSKFCFAFLLALPLLSRAEDESPIRQELRALDHGPFIQGWQKMVGAQTIPTATNEFLVPAPADPQMPSTINIQHAIDACAASGGGVVTFPPGTYVSGSLFLKSNVHFEVPREVMLLGSTNDDDWPIVHTRVAGIEMDWRAAFLNVRGQTNVAITGDGTIDARGKHFWNEFGAAAADYSRRHLRWALDYDIKRPHFIEIYESRDVTLSGLTLENSPFWTVHVVYSRNVTVDGLTIRNNLAGKGPSTDGVNVDSSAFCLVQHCDVDNNDDDFTFKSGMNADGLRVNLPVQYTLFRDDTARHGGGVITLGSDMSGGIRHVEAVDMHGIGTDTGIRFKSARVRGGVVDDVLIHDIKLENVPNAITFNLNWFPQYSYPVIPDDITNIPPVWKILATKVPPDQGIPHFRNITIENVEATGAKTGLKASAYPEAPIENVTLRHIHIQAQAAGSIANAKDWKGKDVQITGADGKTLTVKDSEDVKLDD